MLHISRPVKWLLLVAWCVFAPPLNAQFSKQIHFKNISVREGLSYPRVTCILQDRSGFMWVGTDLGLNRYDGRQFTIYLADATDSTRLSNDQITALYEDERDRLWVGTLAGLNVYDRRTSRFQRFAHPVLGEESIKAIAGDGSGRVFVITERVLLQLDERLKVVRELKLAGLSSEPGMDAMTALHVDADDRVWINTNVGLRRYDAAAGRMSNPLADDFIREPGVVEFVSTIYFDSAQRIWVSDRGNGLRYYDPGSRHWTVVENLSSRFINGVIEDREGRIWIGTGRNGLNILDPATGDVDVIQYGDQPESNFVTNSLSCIYADDAGGVWIGTFTSGLEYYYQHQMRYNLYFPKGENNGINSNYITSFAPTKNNDLWVGAGEEGLLYYDRSADRFEKFTPTDSDSLDLGRRKENNYIMSLLLTDAEDHLLIGTLTGFYDYHLATGRWNYFHHANRDKKLRPGSLVSNILQDGRKIYLSNLDGLQLYDLDDGSLDTYRLPDSTTMVTSLVHNDSVAYLSTRTGGLYVFSKHDRTFRHHAFPPEHPPLTAVTSLYLDAQNRLIICSDHQGQIRYSPDLTEYEMLSGLPPDKHFTVMSICEDPSDGYWLATNQGLVRVDGQWRVRNILDHTEGFQPTYFNRNGLVTTSRGEIVVGGNSGMYAFDPANLHTAPTPNAQVHLTDFLLLNRSAVESDVAGFRVPGELAYIDGVRLPVYQNLITFEYTALDYHNPSRMNYAYRLHPYEEDWNYVGSRNYATYRDLPAGDYTFEVKYRGARAEFAGQTASLAVHLPPRPWQSGWAYLGYGIVLFLLGRQFYLFRRHRRQLRQEVVMQRFEREKMEELYNFKIDFFTQITHELRTPLTLIIGPLEEIISRSSGGGEGRLLRLIHRNTHKLLHRVNQILDFRKIEQSDMKVFGKKGNIVAFAEEILYGFLGMAEEKGIRLHFETNMEKYPYVIFDRDVMEKIVTNLVANAVKFTDAGSVTLKVTEPEDSPHPAHYHLRVTDTGRGIKPENLDKVFTTFFQEQRDDSRVGSGLGLHMVKQLTVLHRGSIEVTSTLYEGTQFTLSFPKADLELMHEDSPEPRVSNVPTEFAPIPERERISTEVSEGKLLVVDDEPDVRELIEEMFADRHEVFTAESAERALELARTAMPDLIICDVMMPGMDGYAFCTAAKADFLLGHIPIILLTALNSTDHEIEGLRTGADAYVTKPFPTSLLRARVENLLRSRKRLKQAFLHSTLLATDDLVLNQADQAFIDRVVEYIDQRLDDGTLEVADISEELGMSNSTFYRKLKSLTDLSGNEFIRTIRLKRSLDLLQRTELNISEIGYRVGFSDPKYFSTCFKRLYQMTPTEFQARQRDKATP
ncbi:signal transduction histidine kinase/ligand-binding sensor domain-containing protein/DNA-binding response OmpR family regulator [Lewinella aquimaris]|uniref:histidine kinase n=1 Tax=Neolewinella aquimaris TaxID=1835722 RepID=A0A840EB13_9BACT|nr:hybrid sensor histidine kinase/response regulator transcription factor [Neolewinella aquimaris]MBB4080735.1 signal transduction histidine kinase/ligand-binding sensor domain-containing protein/DNA-binding response OmpR family regulator [Neolewinella aquimaris]